MGIEYTYNGTRTWMSDGMSWSATWEQGRNINNNAMSQLKLTTSGTISVKLKWKNKFNANDKPAQKVIVKVSAYAMAQGGGNVTSYTTLSADNGIGGYADYLWDGNRQSGIVRESVKTYQKQSPADYDRDAAEPTIDMGSFALSATFEASGNPVFNGAVSVNLTAAVYPWHAHPTNMRVLPPVTSGQGVLNFKFVWDSTSGATYGQDLSELQNIEIREYVTYSGDGTYGTAGSFLPADPPWAYDAPVENPQTGATQRGDSPPLLDQHVWLSGFHEPLRNSTFYGTQYYRFNCTDCMPDGDWEILMGPITITRSVYYDEVWWFRIEKLGYVSLAQLTMGP
jgi:hypothetical protein